MSDQHDEIEIGVKGDATRPDVPDAARRRLVGAGVAAPVVLTLMNRPALATDVGGPPLNCSVSGWVQLGLSLAPSGSMQRMPCDGNSPGYWKNSDFPGKGTQNADTCRWVGAPTFQDLFGAPPVPISSLVQFPIAATYTLGDVLNSEEIKTCIHQKAQAFGCHGQDRPQECSGPLYNKDLYPNLNGSLAFHAAAMYANSVTGQGYPLPLEQIVQMYLATFNGGTYNIGTVSLSAVEVQRFWESTYHTYALNELYWYSPPGS